MRTFIKLLLLVAGFSANAQNSISGKITDIENTPLTEVEIHASEIHKGTTTKKDGTYILKNIPNGKIKITISYLGYKTISYSLNTNTYNKALVFALKEEENQLDEIIIRKTIYDDDGRQCQY